MKKGVTRYKPNRLLVSFYIADFQYHDGACVLGNLKAGKKLKLVSEFDNPHDSEAVTIYWKKAHLGCAPQKASAGFRRCAILGIPMYLNAVLCK